MLTGAKEYLEEIAKTHVCPDHGDKLVVAWHTGENSYVIRCGEGHFPEEVTKALTPTAEYKQGKREPVGKGLDLLPRTDLATGELLSPNLIQALIAYAKRYDLDAYRGHVMLMYGKPYIGLDGYLYRANRSGTAYQLRSRPLNVDERQLYRVGDNDHAWTCEITIVPANLSFTGLGVVTQEEIAAMSTKNPKQFRSPVVAAHPWQLAQKRAEWQALRRAFPIGETEETKEVRNGS